MDNVAIPKSTFSFDINECKGISIFLFFCKVFILEILKRNLSESSKRPVFLENYL